MRYLWLIVSVCVLSLPAGLRANDDAFAEATKKMLTQYGPAVVWLGATAKIDVGSGRVQEERGRFPGAVIDANGLILTSLNRIDPSTLIVASIKKQRESLNPSVTISDIKITWADGVETPGEIVFKDPDMDLAFVKPQFAEGKSCPVAEPIALTGNSEAGIFDRVVSLGRLEDRYQRELVVVERRIAAVVKRPRRLYYIQDIVPGAPVFTETGTFLGLAVTRFSQQEGPESLRTFVLPVEDIRDVAVQVH